eukprot:2929425-Rhodomonas_salina.1
MPETRQPAPASVCACEMRMRMGARLHKARASLHRGEVCASRAAGGSWKGGQRDSEDTRSGGQEREREGRERRGEEWGKSMDPPRMTPTTMPAMAPPENSLSPSYTARGEAASEASGRPCSARLRLMLSMSRVLESARASASSSLCAPIDVSTSTPVASSARPARRSSEKKVMERKRMRPMRRPEAPRMARRKRSCLSSVKSATASYGMRSVMTTWYVNESSSATS